MPREGLPFKTTGEPKRIAVSISGTEVFGFTPEEGKEYVYKEIRPNSRVFGWYFGETLEETASLMKKASDILERHLGEYIVPAHFMIAENRDGRPCIMVAQEKVKGKTVDALIEERLPKGLSAAEMQDLKESLYQVSSDIIRQRTEIKRRLEEAERDPDLIKLFRAKKLVSWREGGFFTPEVMYRTNQIVDENGHVRIVDW